MRDSQLQFSEILAKTLWYILIYFVLITLVIALVVWLDNNGYGEEMGWFFEFIAPLIDFIRPLLKLISYLR